jgi:predicted protein tyrosine phosphatase
MEFRPPFGLTVCGIDELAGNCRIGVTHVLSILDPDWPVPEAFGSFDEHTKLELRFHDVIEEIPGTLPPNRGHVMALLAFGRTLATAPGPNPHLLVHCHAGVSRSTACMALILAEVIPLAPAREIFQELVAIRPQAWPNLRVLEIGDSLLARGGALVGAAAEVYARQLQARPDLAEAMERGERGREVALAGRATASPA